MKFKKVEKNFWVVSSHLMANQRRKDKRMIGFYATKEEAEALMAAAKAKGMTLADWLRWVIAEDREQRASAAKKSEPKSS